jgi:hypothetical protein
MPSRLSIVFLRALFDVHVLKFAGLENFAALLALHELRVFVAAHNLNAWVPARCFDFCVLARNGRLGGHKIRKGWEISPEFHGILERLGWMSSPCTSQACGFIAGGFQTSWRAIQLRQREIATKNVALN